MEIRPRRRLAPASVIMIAAMFGVICAMVSSALAPVTYRAIATALVSTPGVTDLVHLRGEEELRAQTVRSFAAVATSPAVLDRVVRDLRLPLTEAELAARIAVRVPADTAVIQVGVSDSNPATSAAIANAVVKQLAVTAADLQPRASGSSPSVVSLLQRAVAAQAPSGLALPLVVLLGLASGGGIAAFALLVAWLLRRRPPSEGLLAPSML